MKKTPPKTLFAITFFYALATASIATIETVFLKHISQTNYVLMGIILGTGAIGYLLFAPNVHQIPKKIGKKTFLIWTSMLLGTTAIYAANIQLTPYYLIIKTILLLLIPVSFSTILADIEESFSFSKIKDTLLLGIGVTALIGGIVGYLLTGYIAKTVVTHGYILAGLSYLLAGFISLRLPAQQQEYYKPTKNNLLKRIETLFETQHKGLTILTIVLHGYWAVRDFIIPLLILELGYGVREIGILFAIGALAGIGSMYVTKLLLEQNHSEQVLLAALLVAAIVATLLPFGSFVLIGILYAIYVATDSMISPAIQTHVEETTPEHTIKQYTKSLSTAAALGWVISPILAGLLLETQIGIRGVLFIGGVLLLVTYAYLQKEYLPRKKYFPTISLKKTRRRFHW